MSISVVFGTIRS